MIIRTVTGRTPECDGCGQEASCRTLELAKFAVHLGERCWSLLLGPRLAAFARHKPDEEGMRLERALVLQWWAMLHAAAHSPAGFDQEVTGMREDVERIMRENGQAPLSAVELAMLECIVHVRAEGDRLYPGMQL